ncbi:diguanylate cyclase [Chloroflexota bacterium]
MEMLAIVPLGASIIYFLLLLVIVFSRRWEKQHRLFAFYLILACLWTFSVSLLRSDLLVDHKPLLFRMAMFTSMAWAVQLFYFIRSFLKLPAGLGTWFGYASLLTFGLLIGLSDVRSYFILNNGIVSYNYGWWFVLWTVPLVVLTILVISTMVQRYRTIVEPIARNNLGYLIMAICVLVLFGFTGVTPLARGLPISHLGGLLSALILTYSIVKHELVSISFILRRALAWVGLVAIAITAYMGLFFLVDLLTAPGLQAPFVALITLSAGAITVIVFWLRNFFTKQVDHLFYKKTFDYREQLSDFIRHGIRGVFNLQELSENLLPPLVKVLDCQQSYMLLPKSGSGDFVAEYSEPFQQNDPPLRIGQESPILEWLGRENRYLTSENMDIAPEFRGLWEKERDKLRSLGIELLLPLVSRSNLIGILALGRKQSGRYSFEDLNLLESISRQVAISLEKEYFQEKLKKREQELALINRLAGVITSSLHIQEVYDTFIAGLREVINVDFATVALIEGNKLRISALYTEVGSAWQIGEIIPLKGSGTEWVIRHKKGLVEPDLNLDRMFFTGEKYLKHGIRSIVYLPLITKDEGIGSLVIACCNPHAYSEEQVHLLERLSSQVSTSVANAQLYASAEHRSRIDELTSLFNRRHFDESIKQEIDRHSRYGSMLSLVLIDLDNFKRYNDLMGHVGGDKLLTRIGRSVKESLRNIDLAFRYGGDEFAIILPHTSADDAFSTAERVRKNINSEIARESVLVTASLGLASCPSDGLSSDDIMDAADRTLYYAKQTGGNRTCVVPQMLPSLTEPIELAPDIEKGTLNTIIALASTIEARDPHTYGHSRKVRSYAVALAEALGLPSDKVTVISHAALLHDIGKIGIIDGVLNKAGNLDTQELEIIKSHPQFSRTIVGHVPSLTPCLPSILHHHEHWDGTGYPDGLKGVTIPLEARIMAIADAFDAMTSQRPYRAPLSCQEAADELKRCAGIQFDPELIEVFLPIALTATPRQLEVV